jgi:deoxyribodipyrimidine photo-lyase
MPKPYRRALCWVRRDLRLHDHAALAAATRATDSVAVAFTFDSNILDALADRDDRRVTFIHRSLREMDAKLRALGSALVVRLGDPTVEIPALAAEMDAEAVFAARDYEPYAQARDAQVRRALEARGIAFRDVKDSVLMEPREVQGPNGPYRVYTPYLKAWRRAFSVRANGEEHVADLAALATDLDRFERSWTMADVGFRETDLWLEPGEDAARRRAEAFAARLGEYHRTRDFPAQDGTSGLSVHLRFGTVSVRELARMAIRHGGDGAEKWLDELVWRDFYQSILYHFPHVIEAPFQAQYGNVVYPGEDAHFDAWRDGRTGYPIVDAAMRCLRATGWMHNRLRMIVASFLTKDLLIDYRRGEAHFARYLLDFDLASNNGGWQWAASTGCDAQPYFRIFNPTAQSAKFDPHGDFIRRWVPELAELSGAAIHCPAQAPPMELTAAGVELGVTYPHPVVDHAAQRERAIQLLATAKRTERCDV